MDRVDGAALITGVYVMYVYSDKGMLRMEGDIMISLLSYFFRNIYYAAVYVILLHAL